MCIQETMRPNKFANNLQRSLKLISFCRAISSKETDFMQDSFHIFLPIHIRGAVEEIVQLQQLRHTEVEEPMAATL